MRLPTALALAAWTSVAFAASGCGRPSIVGLHCEGGVKDTGKDGPGRYEALVGECLQVTGDRPDADPATIGSATWFADSTHRLVVRSAGKGEYTLHGDGEQVGTARLDGSWLQLVFTKVPPGSRTFVNHTYRLRSDAPGPFI